MEPPHSRVVGSAHRGQGTRNRRLVWRNAFFELLSVTDVAEARANVLRLDRRAEWRTTGPVRPVWRSVAGNDTLYGQAGNDTIDALDGFPFRDRLNCGSDTDSTTSDSRDVRNADCENNTGF